MSTARRTIPPHEVKRNDPRSVPLPPDMFNLSVIGEYVVISETPLKFSPHASGAGILHGEVIATSSVVDAMQLGRYVTISPTIPLNGMRAAAAAIGRIEKTATASSVVQNASFVIVSDKEPSAIGNFPCDFEFINRRSIQASKGKTLKYITLCEKLPTTLDQTCGHVIGNIFDVSVDLGLKSLMSCNVVMAVELPDQSDSEEDKVTELDFLASASEQFDTLLEKTATGLADGTLAAHSNADEVAFMSDMIRQLENLVASEKSVEGCPKTQ